jgi:Ca2+-transporting ATPase
MLADYTKGLSDQEVLQARSTFGSNKVGKEKEHQFQKVLKEVVLEPLFLILIGVAFIYFLLDQKQEAYYMLGALVLVSGISVFQENRSRSAVASLRKLTNPKARVIRNNEKIFIDSSELVVGDILLLEDGNLIPADAQLLELHDFTVNESILTGESLPVIKNITSEFQVYQGTLVQTGSAFAKVTTVGTQTALNKLGKSIQEVKEEKTPLQIQLGSFVKKLVLAGVVAFAIVFGLNLYTTQNFWHALLHGLTLAMSVIPEEIPVALSTFMALGAYRMYRNKVIVRSPHTVETLGAATVLCADKTGTLTENKMELHAIYTFEEDKLIYLDKDNDLWNEVLDAALWASETEPFDAMEISIHHWYERLAPIDKRPHFQLIQEYPLAGDPPVMTHVFSDDQQQTIIAMKGSVEGVLTLSTCTEKEKAHIHEQVRLLAEKGFRVLGVAMSTSSEVSLPKSQFDLKIPFKGLLAFYDPPKPNISQVLKQFDEAGIQVKMITGDHLQTANSIANQIRLKHSNHGLTGKQIMAMEEKELDQKVKATMIFARMFPEAKLRVIEALKRNGEIVAMTGDGVNDGPALKAAHIGIAMGLNGSEVAKSTASLILVDDDLAHLTEAVALGRRIFENLKKAIRYIIAIHIPIILIVTLPFLLLPQGLELFTPIHVIFLELLMGPTCSIIFENEPIEKNTMKKKPRNTQQNLFTARELWLNVAQGIAIASVCFVAAYWIGSGEETLARTLVFTTLVLCNVLLTLVSRSYTDSLLRTVQYKNFMLPLILAVSVLFLMGTLYLPFLQNLFMFSALTSQQLLICLLMAGIGVGWIEVWKMFSRKRKRSS